MFYNQDLPSPLTQVSQGKLVASGNLEVRKEKEAHLLKKANEILFHLVKNELVRKPRKFDTDELITQRAEFLSKRIITIHKAFLGYYSGHDITADEMKEASVYHSDALAFITSLQSMKKVGKSLDEIQKFISENEAVIPKQKVIPKDHGLGAEYELADTVLKMFNSGAMHFHITDFLKRRIKEIEAS